jgi:hypothetical protein
MVWFMGLEGEWGIGWMIRVEDGYGMRVDGYY